MRIMKIKNFQRFGKLCFPKQIFVLLILILLAGCTQKSIQGTYSGELFDVTNGGDVLSINTNGAASGNAEASFENGVYSLRATFENLPDPENNEFYEGWIVRKGINFDVLSTGVAQKVDGVYINEFSLEEDISDHTFYVLTIEPDDGNPAPADHILEGDLS